MALDSEIPVFWKYVYFFDSCNVQVADSMRQKFNGGEPS